MPQKRELYAKIVAAEGSYYRIAHFSRNLLNDRLSYGLKLYAVGYFPFIKSIYVPITK
jgi:hypothetical protein